MEYLLRLLYGFTVIICLHKPINACSIEDRTTGCAYTVLCTTFAGPVNNPGCNGSPNVTLTIKDSMANILTYGFFSSTNFDSRVRSFNAKDNQWEIIERYALKYYRGSTSVDLSLNRIVTIENGAFLDLVSMKYLNVSHNKLENLYNKSLQVSETVTSPLEVLDLSYNQFTDLYSDVFLHFPNLQELYLQNNQIKIMSDTSFNNLKSLRNLHIQNNKICSINMTLALLSELSYLDISNNCINKLVGFEMIRLVSLNFLNMSHNDIESIDHTSFTQVSKLMILDLNSNRISSNLEKDMFANIPNLMYLNVYNNSVRLLSPNVFQHNDLHYLNVEKNNITGAISSETFKGLQKITSLNITYQNVESIKNYAFSGMETLQYLNISNNCINLIENASFVNASSLTVLDISYNKINNLYFFEMFTSNLSEIYLSNNEILIIQEKTFKNHNNLNKLDISRNLIVEISQNALPLNNLQYLKIHHNNLGGIIPDNVFSPAKLLRTLDLSNFKLNKLNDSALVNLPLVTKVNLSHNHLDFIHPNNFKGVGNLYSLDISYNNLADIILENNLQKLLSIYLNNNKFTRIPDIFGGESNLDFIDISDNKISNLSDPSLKNIRHIEVLRLSSNSLTHFNNEYTNSFRNLTVLVLSNNNIKEMVDLSFFKSLESVNVSNNEISTINSSQFENLQSLKYLALSGNKIKTLNPGTFQHLPSLISLDLSSNEITDVRFGSFRGLNSTLFIYLMSNKIKNLNFEVFHECSQVSILGIDYNYISTIDIERVISAIPHLHMLSLGGNPIACEEIVRSKSIGKSKSPDFLITSVHKVYHEDNVHGIKCGNTTRDTVETTTVAAKAEKIEGISTVSVLFLWCGILSLVLILGALAFYFHKRRYRLPVNRESRMQFQNSSNSECYGDLLN